MTAWHDKLSDETYPLYTISVVADLLDVDVQVVRRLDQAGIAPDRSEGGHRRYSRADVERLAYALDLSSQGMTRDAIFRILELESEVERLQRQIATERDRRKT